MALVTVTSPSGSTATTRPPAVVGPASQTPPTSEAGVLIEASPSPGDQGAVGLPTVRKLPYRWARPQPKGPGPLPKTAHKTEVGCLTRAI
jgi:hypothetical protein